MISRRSRVKPFNANGSQEYINCLLCYNDVIVYKVYDAKTVRVIAKNVHLFPCLLQNLQKTTSLLRRSFYIKCMSILILILYIH